MLVGDGGVDPDQGLPGQSLRLFSCQPQSQKDLEPEGQGLERPQGDWHRPPRESVIPGPGEPRGAQGSWCRGTPPWVGKVWVQSLSKVLVPPSEAGCLRPPRAVFYHPRLGCSRMLGTF